MPITEVAGPIALAVLKVAVIALVGYVLARRGVLHPTALTDLSRLVIQVAVPCLVFSNAAAGFTGLSLLSTLVTLAAGGGLLGLSYLSGAALTKLLRVQPAHRRAVVAASTFQNSAYLPIAVATSVLPPLAALFPADTHAASTALDANSLVLISVFSVLYSPIFWGLGFWWITEQPVDRAGPRFAWASRLLPPPVIGVLAGYAVGLTPLHWALTPDNAPLHFLFQAVADIGSAAIPLANLILGGTLAQALLNRAVQRRDTVTTIGAKLIVTPALTLLLLWLCRAWWQADAALSLAAFVVFLQSTSPPATNLAVMAKGFGGAEGSRTPLVIPGLLLAAYPAAMLTMPLWLLLFFRLLHGASVP